MFAHGLSNLSHLGALDPENQCKRSVATLDYFSLAEVQVYHNDQCYPEFLVEYKRTM